MSENGTEGVIPPVPQDSAEPQPRILVSITAHPNGQLTLESPLPTDRMIALMFQMLVQSVNQKPEPSRIISPGGYIKGLRGFLQKKPRPA